MNGSFQISQQHIFDKKGGEKRYAYKDNIVFLHGVCIKCNVTTSFLNELSEAGPDFIVYMQTNYCSHFIQYKDENATMQKKAQLRAESSCLLCGRAAYIRQMTADF